MRHAREETRKLGLAKQHLSTDLEGYYEKYDWTLLTTQKAISLGNGFSFKIIIDVQA